MDKLFKTLETIIPLLLVYPRWFQALSVVCLCVVALTLVLGIVLYPQASRQKAEKDAKENIIMNLSVVQGNGNSWAGSSYKTLTYEIERADGNIVIQPSMGYLSTLASGGPIRPISYTCVPFEWDFPTLDVKVVNNSEKTVFLNEAVFKIDESTLDPTPVLIISPDSSRTNALHFCILNEGWGTAEELRISFHLIPLNRDEEPRYDGPFPHSLDLGDLDESLNVDVSQSFIEKGVNIEGLSSLRIVRMSYGEADGHQITYLDKSGKEITISGAEFEAMRSTFLGEFKSGGAILSGQMRYKKKNVDGSVGEHLLSFTTVVWLFNEYSGGAPRPPSYEYGTKFEVEGKDYERRMNISHEIKPGETDRFLIKIGMEKSSVHAFHMKLLYNNRTIETEYVRLTAFVPRSGARHLESSASGSVEANQ